MFFKRAGKGLTLAFFFIFLSPLSGAQQLSNAVFPEIRRLDAADIGFRQLANDVEANRIIAARVNNRQTVYPPAAVAENLTIYQYTVRQSDDIFFLAARSNIPYSAIVSLNRISSPSSVSAGKTILLPSYPGIFIPMYAQSDLELILGAARQETQGGVELIIRVGGLPQSFLFFPGADFTPTERAYFLNSGFRFPLRNYRITSPYGARNDPFTGEPSMHQGIDLAAPEGTEVFAIADGTVTAAGYSPVYGNYIIISHSGNWTSLYGHLLNFETTLRSEVKSGNLI